MVDEPDGVEGPQGQAGAPGAVPSQVLNYAGATAQPKLVTIRRASNVEAEMARAKLEGEGIPAVVIDQNAGAINLALLQGAQLQVFDADVAAAELCLSRVADNDADGEYVDEEYRCPRCHKKSIEFLPRSPAGKKLLTLSLILLIYPVLAIGLSITLPPADMNRALGGNPELLWFAWVLVEAALAIPLWLRTRGKRCRDCGAEWGRGANPNAGSSS